MAPGLALHCLRMSDIKTIYIVLKWVNPYKPSVLFVGQRQKV